MTRALSGAVVLLGVALAIAGRAVIWGGIGDVAEGLMLMAIYGLLALPLGIAFAASLLLAPLGAWTDWLAMALGWAWWPVLLFCLWRMRRDERTRWRIGATVTWLCATPFWLTTAEALSGI